MRTEGLKDYGTVSSVSHELVGRGAFLVTQDQSLELKRE
jgi:hypothetical protein